MIFLNYRAKFLVGLRTYQHPGSALVFRAKENKKDVVSGNQFVSLSYRWFFWIIEQNSWSDWGLISTLVFVLLTYKTMYEAAELPKVRNFTNTAAKRAGYFRGSPPATCISICCRYSDSHVSQNNTEAASILKGNLTSSALKVVLMRAAHVVMASYGFPGKHLTQGRSASHCAIRSRRCRCWLQGIPWSL